MKLIVFGSLTEAVPRPGRNGMAWALEKDGMLHWFDAGENCSRTMYFMDRRAEQIGRIFISHFHIGRFGGLMGLLGTLRRAKEACRTLPVYTPEEGIFPLINGLWERTSPCCGGTRLEERPLFLEEREAEMDGVKVSWRPNTHMTPDSRGRSRSWSFRIEAEGKSIVCAGDSDSPDELGEWLRAPDLLLLETGRRSAPELCRKFKREKRKIGRLVFFDHGAETPDRTEKLREQAGDIWDGELCFAEDGRIFEL